MSQLHISNERIALSIAPEFGARLTTLIDRGTDRNWLVDGALVGERSDEAVFGGDQARGWDECFPTVAPCADRTHGRQLRDHGDLWGRPWTCSVSGDAVQACYEGAGYRFVRDLKLTGDTMELVYQVTNCGSQPIPYLWSQHCLLATGLGDRIDLEGIGPMTVSVGRSVGAPLTTGQFEWPDLLPGTSNLRPVLDATANFFMKAYAPVCGQTKASVTGSDGSINFSWANADIPFLGLWLDYGGWPEECPVHQIAIEPTTAAADDLAGALRNNQAQWLDRRETRRWTVEITLSSDSNHRGTRYVG
jgi:hypothetical protein